MQYETQYVMECEDKPLKSFSTLPYSEPRGKGALYMLTSYLGSTGNWVLEAGVEVSLAIENSVFVGTGGGILVGQHIEM